MNSIAQTVDDGGRKVSSATGANLAVQLRSARGEFLGWLYETAPGKSSMATVPRLDLSPPLSMSRLREAAKPSTQFQPTP